jgi:alkanesulfonate monooxygenase SsuD/methylene tetrahydromethanopterin reductase-like flavin-dependent oxidoreductase (luciferase family)
VEAIYIGGLEPAQSVGYFKEIRAEVGAMAGIQHLRFYVGSYPIIGKTIEEAQAKYENVMANTIVIGRLAQFSGYTSTDLSRFPIHKPFGLKDSPDDRTVRLILDSFKKVSNGS